MNPSAYNDRSTFIRRLAYFLIGTAIGLVTLSAGSAREIRPRVTYDQIDLSLSIR